VELSDVNKLSSHSFVGGYFYGVIVMSNKEYKTKQQQHKFYTTSDWNGVNGVRNQALIRDHYECAMCAKEGKVHLDSVKVKGERKSIQLNVHHIKELERYPELALEIDNLMTVCLDHHNDIHGRYKLLEMKWRDEKW